MPRSSLAYGLARMSQRFRELSGGKRVVQIFETETQALAWLNGKEPPYAH
jgi:hypothetical protein